VITNHVYQLGKGNKGTAQLNNLFGYVDRFLLSGGIVVTSHLVKIKFLLDVKCTKVVLTGVQKRKL